MIQQPKLTMVQRKCIWKLYRQGRSYTEIAIIMSDSAHLDRFVTRNTIAGAVFRIRHNEKLRIELDKELFK
jgi:hypothetical protein